MIQPFSSSSQRSAPHRRVLKGRNSKTVRRRSRDRLIATNSAIVEIRASVFAPVTSMSAKSRVRGSRDGRRSAYRRNRAVSMQLSPKAPPLQHPRHSQRATPATLQEVKRCGALRLGYPTRRGVCLLWLAHRDILVKTRRVGFR